MLVDQLKANIEFALRTQNELAKGVLRLVLSDAQRVSDNPTDDVVIKVCRKIIEANLETMKLGGEKVKLLRENALLAEYVPSEATLDEVQIHADRMSIEISDCKSEGQAIGLLSKYLKSIGVSTNGEILKKSIKGIRGII